MNNKERLESVIKQMNDTRYHIEQARDSADYYYDIGDTLTGEEKMLEVSELEDNLRELKTQHDQLMAELEHKQK